MTAEDTGRKGKAKREPGLAIALKYAVFAAIATAANIGVQRIALAVYQGRHALWAAMACGTFAGLLLTRRRVVMAYRALVRGRGLEMA